MDRVLEYMMDNAADREVWDMADQGKKKKKLTAISKNMNELSNPEFREIYLRKHFHTEKSIGVHWGKLDTLHKSQLR